MSNKLANLLDVLGYTWLYVCCHNPYYFYLCRRQFTQDGPFLSIRSCDFNKILLIKWNIKRLVQRWLHVAKTWHGNLWDYYFLTEQLILRKCEHTMSTDCWKTFRMILHSHLCILKCAYKNAYVDIRNNIYYSCRRRIQFSFCCS